MNANTVDEMADETITWIRNGRLYYRHQSGLFFTVKMRELADANEEDEPYPVHLLGGVPADVGPGVDRDARRGDAGC